MKAPRHDRTENFHRTATILGRTENLHSETIHDTKANRHHTTDFLDTKAKIRRRTDENMTETGCSVPYFRIRHHWANSIDVRSCYWHCRDHSGSLVLPGHSAGALPYSGDCRRNRRSENFRRRPRSDESSWEHCPCSVHCSAKCSWPAGAAPNAPQVPQRTRRAIAAHSSEVHATAFRYSLPAFAKAFRCSWADEERSAPSAYCRPDSSRNSPSRGAACCCWLSHVPPVKVPAPTGRIHAE